MLRFAVFAAVACTLAHAQVELELVLKAQYVGGTCAGPPLVVEVEQGESCAVGDCHTSTSGVKTSTTCSSEASYHDVVRGLFDRAPYILRESFGDSDCSTFESAQAFAMSNNCVRDSGTGMFVLFNSNDNGSVSVQYFHARPCSAETLSSVEDVPKELVEGHSCDSNGHKWYTSSLDGRSLTWIMITDLNDTDTSAPTDGTTSSSTLGTSEDTLDGTASTSSTTADTSTTTVDDAADTTSLGVEDVSTTDTDPTSSPSSRESSKTTSASTGSSSSGDATEPEATTATSEVVESPTSSAASNTDNDTGSSSQSDVETATDSSSAKARKSRVSVTTTAPELEAASTVPSDASSSAGSLQENAAADTSVSSSSTPTSETTAKSSVSTGAIVGIVMAGLVVGIVIVGSIVRRRRCDDDDIPSPLPNAACRRSSGPYWGQTSPVNRPRRSQQRYSEPRYTDSLASRHSSSQKGSSGQVGLWSDDVITAKRIPKDKVEVREMLSRGAFGEVYRGFYNRKPVAVKMLLPQLRGDINQVNEFLSEAKMTAIMEHPHIISFIGVAWDSLSDVCVVLEFMDGGDLRSLLTSYEAARHPVGFDREKVTIALQVCHALAYMHSLAPPVIHRDLKSRNILLTQAMEAKLTDFGISRERLDRTMTAGVGTSLWMAPEVMMGEKYDDKADVFSFGVVLSELDVHALPYAKAMATSSANGQMACAVMMQKVALGTLRVEFSQAGPRSMTELGCACVSVHPSERPTAAQVLYKLQTVLNRELP